MKFFVVLAFCLAVASAIADTIEQSLIANGKTAAEGQFPYQVGLAVKMNSLQSGWCGGSLIGQKWILTAAHYFPYNFSAQSITAYLGGTVRMRAEVTRFNIVSVPLSSNIQTVKLPAPGTTNSYVNSFAIASGWGRMGDSARSEATNLQYGRMKVVEDSQCSFYYGCTRFNSNNLCVATRDHISPCQGDSGGPLVLESGDKAQIGLLSYGSETGRAKGHPIVFTRVSSYLDWIKQYSGVHS